MEWTTWTGRGTAGRPQKNSLVDFCEEEALQMLAVQLPGRGARHRENQYENVQALCCDLFEVLLPFLADPHVPYAIAAHSLGCLVAFELLRLVQSWPSDPSHSSSSPHSSSSLLTSKPPSLPLRLYFSCMVSPDLPPASRPWTPADQLDEAGLQEEARAWSVNEAIFKPSTWPIFSPMLRADFHLFDHYTFKPYTPNTNAAAKDIPTRLFAASQDNRVRPSLMVGWWRLLCPTASSSSSSSSSSTPSSPHSSPSAKTEKNVSVITGTHNFFYDPIARENFFLQIIADLEDLILDLEYS
eukprot:GHVT01000994.1.p1 GENE.GHVT01000994.1~~GHVT01000994.1.p1  ORF type:complete len:298 (+),score=74.86 GHVT01000994.1:583-1476(+)